MANSKKQDTLLPAYLVVGEDALKRATVLKRLRTRVEAYGDLAFNSDEFNGEVAEGAAIVSACNTVPFASDMRLVEVKAAGKLKKADSEELVAYLAAPCATTVLALEAESLAKNTRLYKAVAALGKTAVIDCAPLKARELPRTVRALATGHGVTFSEKAAIKLVELVGEDTVRLDNEVRKVALAHVGPDAVSEQEVLALVARTSEAKPWEFVDAFSARDAKRCVELLGLLGKTSPFDLMGRCTARLRELLCARTLYGRGASAQLAAVLKQPDWRVKNHTRWACGFTAAELRRAISSARDTEQAMKSGAAPETAFFDWVLSVVAK